MRLNSCLRGFHWLRNRHIFGTISPQLFSNSYLLSKIDSTWVTRNETNWQLKQFTVIVCCLEISSWRKHCTILIELISLYHKQLQMGDFALSCKRKVFSYDLMKTCEIKCASQRACPYIVQLSWCLIQFKLFLMGLAAIADSAPDDISKLLPPVSSCPGRRLPRLASHGRVMVPRCRTLARVERGFSSLDPSLWNNLPPDILVKIISHH